jgi:hypothetical protein
MTMLSKSKFLVLGALALAAFAPRSSSAGLLGDVVGAVTQKAELKVGPAYNAGYVTFTLSTLVNGDVLGVEAVIDGPMDATAKAMVVAAAVANADPTGDWRATLSGSKLTFQHKVLGLWLDADLITGYSDTTGSGTKIESVDNVVSFTLTLDEGAVAFGHDAMGEPSFIMVTVTDTLTYTRPFQGGETPEAVLDALQAFLAAEAGEGVTVTRASANSLVITLRYEDSQVNWQITDLGFEAATTAEGLLLSESATLIRKTR